MTLVSALRLFLPVLAMLSALPAIGAPPSRIHATYSVLKDGTPVGIMTDTFEHRGDRYRIVSETVAAGVLALFTKMSIRLESAGRVAGGLLQPLHFEHRRGNDPAKTVSADFDWPANRLTLNHDGTSHAVPLSPGAQDRLSALYQFVLRPPRKSAEIRFPMTNGRKLDDYAYDVRPSEPVATPAARFDAVHLVKQHEKGESGTELWLAPDRHYLPVKMVIEESNGDRLEQVLTHVSFE